MAVQLTEEDKAAIRTLTLAALKEKYPNLSDEVIADIYSIEANTVVEYISKKYPTQSL